MAEHKTFHVLDALEASPARTRRIWSQAAKDLILAEADVPGANVSAVARAHGVSVHQVFRSRRGAHHPAITLRQWTHRSANCDQGRFNRSNMKAASGEAN